MLLVVERRQSLQSSVPRQSLGTRKENDKK
jgi:hypothetical protein